MESLDGDGKLAKSLGAMRFVIIKSKIKHDMEGVVYFEREPIKKRMIFGFYSGTRSKALLLLFSYWWFQKQVEVRMNKMVDIRKHN